MSVVRRAVLFAALAISAVVGGASTASAAITVSNPGTLTMTDSGNLQMHATFFGFPAAVTCGTENYTASVSSSGAVSVSGATFKNCLDGLGGNATLTPTGLSWVAQIKGSAGAYRVDSLNAKLTVATPAGTCAYNGGTVTTEPKPSPLTKWWFTGDGPLTSTTVGCGEMRWTGELNLSKSLSISGAL